MHIAKFTDEQYATINQSTAGRFDPRVFVNCLQVPPSCTPFIPITTCRHVCEPNGGTGARDIECI